MFKKESNKHEPSIRDHKVNFYRQIAFTFIGAALVVLVGLIYFSLSQAVITVTPSLEDVQADFNLLIKSDTDRTDEGVSAQLVFTEVVVDKTTSAELLAEGEDQQATGIVTLVNDSGTAQPLVKTTRLLSEEGVLFRLENDTTVPPNGEVDAEVYADKPGKQGEIGATRFTIPGLNQARQQEVYARSSEAMTGGTKAIYKITQKAVNEGVEALENVLVSQAKNKLESEGVDVSALVDDLVYIDVKSQTINPELGEEVQEFQIQLTADVAFVDANKSDLMQLAQAQLFGNTDLGYELSSSNEGSYTSELTAVDLDKGQAQIHIVLEGQRKISSNHPSLDASNFVGEKPDTVKQQLESEAGIDSAEIELRPFWLRKVPRLVDHIYIQFGD